MDEIGVYPQVEKSDRYDYSLPSCFWNVKWDEKPEIVPTYEANLAPNAIATNLLDKLPGFYGLCVDAKLKKIIEGQNLSSYDFFSVDIFNSGRRMDYYWFHFTESLIPYVDFEQTVFERFRKNQFSILKEFKVNGLEELKREMQELTFEFGIRVKTIKLVRTFPNYDIISLWGIMPIFLISERLKMKLEEMEVTGIELVEFDKLEMESPS